MASVLLLACLILINFIAARLPGQLDLTSQKLYTLSEGSRNLLAKLEEPVTLNFYFSRGLEDLPIAFKNYATRVEELLEQYDEAGGRMVRLNVIDPEPDTEEEDRAIRAGVANQMTPSGGSLFFGLQAIQAEQEATIDFFTLEREPFLEYDISKLIYQVQLLVKPRIGILSSLPVFADYRNLQGRMAPGNMPQDWAFLQELKYYFEVEEIDPEADALPEDIEVLAIIHPKNLSSQLSYAIDQFLLNGGPVFAALDPSSVYEKENQAGGMMGMQAPPSTSSNLPGLLEGWGIQYDENAIIADDYFAATIRAGQGGMPIRYPVWLQIDEFVEDNPAVAQLSLMLFPESGYFTVPDQKSGLKLTPFVETSAKSGTLPGQSLRFANPENIWQQIDFTEKTYTLAGLISGKFASAFPEGPPEKENENGESASENEDSTQPASPQSHLQRSITTSNLILVADTDFLADRFSVQVINFLGMRQMQPLNDNIAFMANAMDYLGGSEDLITLRGKGSAHRPFTRVESIQAAAQQEYQARLDELNERLNEVQSQLNQLQQQQRDQKALIASPELQEAIEEFRLQEASLRAERREIRKRLREDIEALDRTLALLNLLAGPLLISLAGFLFFSRRHNRNR